MANSSIGLAAATVATVLLALPHPGPSLEQAPQTCVPSGQDSRGRSSVDEGVIAWEDDTEFDDARTYAVGQWTSGNLKKVTFHPDTASEIADLEWNDTRSSGGDWKNVLARWTGLPGTDSITMNRFYLDTGGTRGTTAHRRRVATHELGHALGFCHKSTRAPSIMWTDNGEAARAGIDRITTTDRNAYHQLWG
ncbi:matrixin family metalloprotease [Streptomyces sp. NPDC058157]|uniref:matrixin family metalloprotease n=1 Tax=Streptomyces sp. NPDC058157 TaxID=3346360 RepID=UPI0036EA24B3